MTLDVSKLTAYAVVTQTTLDISKITAYAVVYSPPDRRLAVILTEPTVGGNPEVRTPYQLTEPATGGSGDVRTPVVVSEPTAGGSPVVRMPLIVLECIAAIPEEPEVATDPLPIPGPIVTPLVSAGVPGVTYSSHKKPVWRTDVASAVSGREVRVARMQVPIWRFELKFDFLDSRDGADPEDQMQIIAGFFNTMRGRWQAFLYTDPTDYMVQGQQIGVGDGGETGFYALHSFNTYTEPVGQINLASLFTFASTDVSTGSDTVTVPDHGLSTGYGPIQFTNPGTLPTGLSANTNYWVIVTSSSTMKFANSYANAIAGTPVDISAAGSGTNTASNSVAVYNNGTEVSPADYTVTMPNRIVFDTAPALNDVLTIDCKYYFVCRFLDDEADFEQFMYKLWALETLEFQTDIP